MRPIDILAFVSPACVVYAGFAYWRVMQMRKDLSDFKDKVRTLAQDHAIDISNVQQGITNAMLEIDKVREGFIQERTCPGCGEVRTASQYDQGDYICQECRKETLDSQPEDGVPC